MGAVCDIDNVSAERPLFDEDTTVYVIKAPDGMLALLGRGPWRTEKVEFCVSSKMFEAPVSGSKFDRYGNYYGGPAPRGDDAGTGEGRRWRGSGEASGASRRSPSRRSGRAGAGRPILFGLLIAPLGRADSKEKHANVSSRSPWSRRAVPATRSEGAFPWMSDLSPATGSRDPFLEAMQRENGALISSVQRRRAKTSQAAGATP